MSEDYIQGTIFASNATGAFAIADDVNQNYYLDTSATCNFGTAFKAGFIGQLSEVKFFMPVFLRDNFVGKLKF